MPRSGPARDLLTTLVYGDMTDPSLLTVLFDHVEERADRHLLTRLLRNDALPAELRDRAATINRAWSQAAIATTTTDRTLLAKLARTGALTVRRSIAGRVDLDHVLIDALAAGTFDLQILDRVRLIARDGNPDMLCRLVTATLGHDTSQSARICADSDIAWLAVRHAIHARPSVAADLLPDIAVTAVLARKPNGDAQHTSDVTSGLPADVTADLLAVALADGCTVSLDGPTVLKALGTVVDVAPHLAGAVASCDRMAHDHRMAATMIAPPEDRPALLATFDDIVQVAQVMPADSGLADLVIDRLDTEGRWQELTFAGAMCPTLLAAAVDRLGDGPDLDRLLKLTFRTIKPGGIDGQAARFAALPPAVRDRVVDLAAAGCWTTVVDPHGAVILRTFSWGTAKSKPLAAAIQRDLAGNPAALHTLLAMDLGKMPLETAVAVAGAVA